MKNKIWYISILVLGLGAFTLSSFLSASEEIVQEKKLAEEVTLQAGKSIYTAGEPIIFETKNKAAGLSAAERNTLKLVLISSFGVTMISSEVDSEKITFIIPKYLSNKTGSVRWKLITNSSELQQGSFNIVPNKTQTPLIESYVGPPTVFAGGKDFAMLTAVPTDIYDNLIEEGTEVDITQQFEAQIETHPLIIKNGIVWKRIFSKDKAGKILLSAKTTLANSQEKEIRVTPNLAIDFSIKTKLIHDYADGNQIAQIFSEKILDAYGNPVTEGTLVNFLITDSKGNLTSVQAATIRGVATANLLHPEFPTQWTIKAVIAGIAQSDSISVDFKGVLEELNVVFSENNRTITVGPIKSYIGQLIPDGIAVTIQHTSQKLATQTRNGMATFQLLPEDFSAGNYQFTIECLGVLQQYSKEIK